MGGCDRRCDVSALDRGPAQGVEPGVRPEGDVTRGMTDLAFLQARIAGYADYSDRDARHQVDKQVRAFLGEALAGVRGRFALPEALLERLDGMMMRCEFSDQRVIRAADHATFDQRLIDRVHQVDREIVECAERLRALDTIDTLPAELDIAARCFDERFGAIVDAPGT